MTQHEPRPTPSTNAERDQRTVELLLEAREASDPVDRLAAREEAIELNLPLARYLASRYQRRGIPNDDLEQVACVGLMKAIKGFSPERTNGFAAYAIPTIRGELRRHFRDAGWTVRPPRRVQELQARVRAVEAELVQTLQRTPTAVELADSIGVEIDDILEATSVDSCYTPNSLDAPVPGSDTVSSDPGSVDPAFARTEARLILEPALRTLGDRDRRILEMRFTEGLTQQQIGDEIGISQMQVSRILSRVLGTMRESIVGEAA
ncbi:MAG: SigB/SigF/SigG family RNA polymerase sigma factor [Propionibacteriales bacterium]|nr:SigB/SigF/SigG family RNA polymerase sigma factor [Propionibacteriales bacterium]